MRRTAAFGGLVTAVLVLLAPAAPAASSPETAAVPRLLVVTLPTVSWADVNRQIAAQSRPRGLARILAGAAVADLSLRSVLRHTSAGEGYATIGAGTRTAGAPLLDNLAFDAGEQFEGGAASAALARRTGHAPPTSGLAAVDLPAVIGANRTQRFGSQPGALGRALRGAGIRTAVIANADTSRTDDATATYGRTAALALADRRGTVAGGEVGRELLRTDPTAPFGVALDSAAVSSALQREFTSRSVVVLEGSDLVRADLARSATAPAARAALHDDALDRTAALLDRVLDDGTVDLQRDAVMVVTPMHSTARVHLGVFALRRPGLATGLARSPTTRRAGFVTLVDVAPTILDWMGVDRPDSMEGRAATVDRRSPAHDESRRALLARWDRDAQARDKLVAPVTVLFVVMQAVLSVVAVLVLGRGRRFRVALEIAALSFFGFLLATYASVAIHLARHGAIVYLAVTVATGVVVASLVRLAGRRADVAPPTIMLSAVVAFFALDMATGAHLQLNAVLGYSPTVGGRFAGVGNLTFAQLSVASILLAGIVAWRPTRERVRIAAAVLAAAIVVDGLPMWGSDVGGVLSMVPAAVVTVGSLSGRRVRLRTAAIVTVVTAAAVGAATAIDLLRPADQRTHLGRLAESIGRDGGSAFTRVAERKLAANLSVLTTSVWTLLVPAVLLFVAYLVYRAPGRLRIIADRAPGLRGSLAGVFVVAVLGFGLNDSGIAVPALMLGMLNPVLVYLSARWT